MILLLVIVVNLLLCLIYKLNVLTSMYGGEHNIYIKVSTIRNFGCPLGVLECIPRMAGGGLLYCMVSSKRIEQEEKNIFLPQSEKPQCALEIQKILSWEPTGPRGRLSAARHI